MKMSGEYYRFMLKQCYIGKAEHNVRLAFKTDSVSRRMTQNTAQNISLHRNLAFFVSFGKAEHKGLYRPSKLFHDDPM